MVCHVVVKISLQFYFDDVPKGVSFLCYCEATSIRSNDTLK